MTQASVEALRPHLASRGLLEAPPTAADSLGAVEHSLGAVEHSLGAVEHSLDAVEHSLGAVEHSLGGAGVRPPLLLPRSLQYLFTRHAPSLPSPFLYEMFTGYRGATYRHHGFCRRGR